MCFDFINSLLQKYFKKLKIVWNFVTLFGIQNIEGLEYKIRNRRQSGKKFESHVERSLFWVSNEFKSPNSISI